jgi:hypothetical protein
VIEYPASHMEVEPLDVSEFRFAAVDFLSLAPLVWNYSLLELAYKTELPQEIPNRSSDQMGAKLSAEFKTLSNLMFYIPSSSLHYSPPRIDKTILPGPPQEKSSPSRHSKCSFRGSSYCKASGMATP